MEFIRHAGDLQCSGCDKVEADRNIYYCFDSGMQLYWFVCGSSGCRAWTRLAFGYQEIGTLAPKTRRRIKKIKKFEDKNEITKYDTNWGGRSEQTDGEGKI